MPFLEVEGVDWQTTIRGTMIVEDDDGETREHSFIRVPIAKASVKDSPGYIEVDYDKIPGPVLTEIIYQGLKNLSNRGMSKITGPKTPESMTQAIEVAKKNLEAMYAGQIRLTGGKAKDVSRAVMTLARQKARVAVRDAIRRAGLKISHYSAKQITQLADGVLASEDGPSFISEARAELEARNKNKVEINLDNLQPDPEMVRKDEEKKAKAKAKKAATPEITQAQIAAHVQATRRPGQPTVRS